MSRRLVTDAAGGNPNSPGELIYSLNALANDEALCEPLPGPVLTSQEVGGTQVQFACNQQAGGAVSSWVPTEGYTPPFSYAGYFGWSADAPAGITIANVSATINVITQQPAVYGGPGWFGETYAGDTPLTSLTNTAATTGWGWQTTNVSDNVAGQTWSMAMTCGEPPYCGGAIQAFGTPALTLSASETTQPQIGVSLPSLASQGWIRNSPTDPWTIGVDATDVSGVCALTVNAGSRQLLATGGSTSEKPSQWMVCNNAAANLSLDTNQFPAGPITLTTQATNGAYLSSATTDTVYADNQTPTVSLSGPTRVATSAGTQHVTASAAAGPSGVAGISCSVDGAPNVWYPGSTASISVAGVGAHVMTCFSVNNALDQNGTPAVSAARSWTTDIGVPTALALSPHRSVPVKVCHSVVERIHVPAHRARSVRHAMIVAAATIKKSVRICKIKTKRVKIPIYKIVRNHGHKHRKRVAWRTVRRPVLKTVPKTRIWTRHGTSHEFSGVLTTTTGVPLPGQTVGVQTATNNGKNRFKTVVTTTTNASGVWKALLPAGPSRLIRAVYAGTTMTNGQTSETITLSVPARVNLRISANHTLWGHAIQLHGKLDGGDLPVGGEVVRLRIGHRRSHITFGIVHVKPGSHGRFTATYRFGLGGSATDRFWLTAATVSQSNYPWAVASSPPVYVTVR